MKRMVIECTPLAEQLIRRLVLTGDCVLRPIDTQPTRPNGEDLMAYYGKATPERSAEWGNYLHELRNSWD